MASSEPSATGVQSWFPNTSSGGFTDQSTNLPWSSQSRTRLLGVFHVGE